MRALLDTHAFVWSETLDRRFSGAARTFIEDESNELYLSAVIAWEIGVKFAKGRLPELPESPQTYVTRRMALLRAEPLPIEVSHALQAASLPAIHADPFDRLLVAQAQLEGLAILTRDPNIAQYDVETIW